MEESEVIIIGAGPAGASAAIYLARYCLNVLVLDARSEIKPRTSWSHNLQNYLGHLEYESGPEFLERIDKHLANYSSITRQQAVVSLVSRDEAGLFHIETANGSHYQTQYLILAVGVRDIMPVSVENIQQLWHFVSHCIACDWYQNKDKKLAVIADDDSGIHYALLFTKMHRPPDLTVFPYTSSTYSKELIEEARKEQITIYQSRLIALKQKDSQTLIATLADKTSLELGFLFTHLGNERIDHFLDRGNLYPDRDESGYLIVDWQTYETSIPNLFAVGPCNAGLDQVSIAVGEGAVAAATLAKRVLSQS